MKCPKCLDKLECCTEKDLHMARIRMSIEVKKGEQLFEIPNARQIIEAWTADLFSKVHICSYNRVWWMASKDTTINISYLST